jgi:hypothetical protein
VRNNQFASIFVIKVPPKACARTYAVNGGEDFVQRSCLCTARPLEQKALDESVTLDECMALDECVTLDECGLWMNVSLWMNV